MKEHVDDFVKNRSNANEVFSSKLVIDAAQIRMLDQHINEFLALLKHDATHHEIDILKKHAKQFEDELHDELEFLFKATKQDLELYQKILKALATYKKELKRLVSDQEMTVLVSSELNYADLLVKSAHEKLDTLALLFKKLRS